jgi:hypothetical protein
MPFYFEVSDVIKDSGQALLVEIDDPEVPEDEAWIPHSQITGDSEVTEEGDSGTMAITTWLAREKGWIE